jgi:hypothetical protein
MTVATARKLDAAAKDKAAILKRFDEGARELLEDTDKLRKEWDAKALADNPKLTQAQLDASWEQAAEQFGL